MSDHRITFEHDGQKITVATPDAAAALRLYEAITGRNLQKELSEFDD